MSRPFVLSCLLFCACLGIGATLISFNEERWSQSQRRTTMIFGDQQVHAMQEEINATMAAANALGAVVKHQGGIPADFEALSANLLSYYTGVSSLRVAPNAVVTRVYPPEKDREVIGRNLTGNGLGSEGVATAMRERRQVLAGPIEGGSGQRTIIGRYPIYFDTDSVEDYFWGFVCAVTPLSDLLEQSGFSQIPQLGYAYSLERSHPETGGRHVFASGGNFPEGAKQEPIVFEIHAQNAHWLLRLIPLEGWRLSGAFFVNFCLTLLLSLFVAYTFYEILKKPEKLKKEVQERTRELVRYQQQLELDMAKRKRVEEALRASEERYRQFFVSSKAVMLLLEPSEGTILDVNNAACSFYGYSHKELVGMNIRQINLLSPEEISAAMEQARNEQREEFHFRHRLASGEIREVEVRSGPLKLGSMELIYSIVHDITARRKAEGELQRHREELEELVQERSRELERSLAARRQSERRYRLLFENTNQGILCYRSDGTMEEANPAACELLGLDLEELKARVSGDERWNVLSSDRSPIAPARMPSALCFRAARPVRDRILWVHNPRLDEYRCFLTNAIPEIPTGDSKPERVWVTLNDITELKHSKQQLERSRSSYKELSYQFQALLNNIPDAIFLVAADRKVLWVNRGAGTLLNKGVEELVDGYCCDLWVEMDVAKFGCLTQKALASGEMESKEFKTHDGRIWDVRVFPAIFKEGEITNVIMVARDVTGAAQLRAESIRAGQLASLGELAAGVAHEINNPINGIINYGQILVDSAEIGEAEKTYCTEIISEGQRIATIVRSLLSFAREQSEEHRFESLEKVLRASLVLAESQLEKEGIKISLSLSEGVPRVFIHAQQIQQVFLNLISNARHALNKRYPGAHPDKQFNICFDEINTPQGAFVRATFEDFGTGIPESLMDRVINPFFSTKARDEGTGLGLSISHGIISDHGGRFTLESVEGEYTRVHVDLPQEIEENP